MRWVVRAVLALGVVAILAVGALFAIPTERIAAIAAERIGQATGRTVRFDGQIRPTLWPNLGIRAEEFEIGNPEWVDDGPLIAADALSVRVPWGAVFSGQIEVEEITLDSPQVILVRASDGRVSWSFDAGDAANGGADTVATSDTDGTADGTTPHFALDQASLTDARILYVDHIADQRFDIAGLDAALAFPASGAASITASASVNGADIALDAQVDDRNALLAGGVQALTVGLTWEGGTAAFDGRASLAPALEGQVQIDANDLGPLLGLVGQSAPDLPVGVGREQITFDGAITLTEAGSLHLRDGDLTLDSNRIALALDITQGAERPLIRGTVSSESLTLPVASAGESGQGAGTGGAAASSGWSRDPIDVSALFLADAEIALRLGSVTVTDTALSPIEARLTNDNGRAVLDIERVGVYGGTLAGQVVVNGRGGLSARTDVILAGVQLSPLLQAAAGYERLEGSGSMSLQVLAVGNDMATLMQSLDGQGDLAFGAGAILGLDIAGMVRNLDTSFQGEGARTVYDSITANFVITDGVLQNDDLLLDAPWGTVTGAGQVDIGAQTLDYRVIPGVLRDDQGQAGIQVPVLISGPWASPSIRPDLAYLAEQELAAEAARLEEEARARLAEEADRLEEEARQRANELLGTELEAGDTVDDAGQALEDRLREEAENQLRRLLGGD